MVFAGVSHLTFARTGGSTDLSQAGSGPDGMRDTLFPKEVRVGGVDKRELIRGLREHNVRLNEAAERQ